MSYGLGVDLGTTYTAAAVYSSGRAETLPIGTRALAIPSTVYVRQGSEPLFGEAAAAQALSDPGNAASEFKRRFGDEAPLLLGGKAFTADQLMVELLKGTLAKAGELQGAAPDRVALTFPATWASYRRDLLMSVAQNAGVPEPVMITEPDAAALSYASHERIAAGSVVGVYDLGGGTFDATILRRTDVGFEIIGQPAGDSMLGGIDFDRAVMNHVALALDESWEQLDFDDPGVARGVEQLHRHAVAAKEILSSDVTTSIPVILPDLNAEVRITRGELEAAILPEIERSLSVFQSALDDAEIAPQDLHSVLLVGGSSRIPLVAEVVVGALEVPVALDTHPKYAVCLGAAIAAGASATDVEAFLPKAAETGVASEAEHLAHSVEAVALQMDDDSAVVVEVEPRSEPLPIGSDADLTPPQTEAAEPASAPAPVDAEVAPPDQPVVTVPSGREEQGIDGRGPATVPLATSDTAAARPQASAEELTLEPPPTKPPRNVARIAVPVILVALVAAVGLFVLNSGGGDPTEAADSTTQATQVPVATPSPPSPQDEYDEYIRENWPTISVWLDDAEGHLNDVSAEPSPSARQQICTQVVAALEPGLADVEAIIGGIPDPAAGVALQDAVDLYLGGFVSCQDGDHLAFASAITNVRAALIGFCELPVHERGCVLEQG